MCIVISNVCAKCNNIFLLVLLTSEKGNVFFHSYMISILEKAKLFDIKYEKKSKSLYWHIIFLLSIWTGSISHRCIFLRFLSYDMFKTQKKKNRRERTYAQRTILRTSNRSLCTYRIQLLPRCMHAQGFNISLLLVRYAFDCSLLFFSLSLILFPFVYMCVRFFDALFFSSSSLRVTHETCCNHFFFVAHFVHSHSCL